MAVRLAFPTSDWPWRAYSANDACVPAVVGDALLFRQVAILQADFGSVAEREGSNSIFSNFWASVLTLRIVRAMCLEARISATMSYLVAVFLRLQL
jgi:hypothetical protein